MPPLAPVQVLQVGAAGVMQIHPNLIAVFPFPRIPLFEAGALDESLPSIPFSLSA